MIKKLTSLILVGCLLLTLTACNSNQGLSTEPIEPTDNIYYKNEYIAINDYREDVFDFYDITVTDEDLQMYINYYILLPNATYNSIYEGTVKKDDYINISVKVIDKNGNIIPEYTTGENGYFLYVGIGDYLSGLDNAVTGMAIGDKNSFETTITVDKETIDVTAEVTVNYLQETAFPEATDELAQKEGYLSIEAFKDEFRTQLEEEYASSAYEMFLDSIGNKTIKEVYKYPDGLIDSYIKKYEDSAKYFAELHGMSLEEYLEEKANMSKEDWYEKIKEEAKQDANIELMFEAILEANKLEFNKEAYQYYLDEFAKESGYPTGKALELSMKEQGLENELNRELKMRYGYDMFVMTAKLRVVDFLTGEVIVDIVEETKPESN